MLRAITRICVRYAERFIPDPYLYALLLTFITAAGAWVFTATAPAKIVTAWYDGIWAILAFAMQMALILATGVALAEAPLVKRLLQRVAAVPKRQAGAAVTVFLVAAVGSWLNWGFGLVVGALLAREVAKRVRETDFGLLVAAAYMGFMVWASGLSSSIALASATPGSALNIIEKETGRIAGLHETIFAAYNLVPTILVIILIPILLILIAPPPAEQKRVDPDALIREDERPELPPNENTFASGMENAWIVTALLVAMALYYEWTVVRARGFTLDINGMIFLALILGLIFHGRPIRYVRAFNAAAKTVGPILLQFPLYGGIMGIMTGTGLAAVIAKSFLAFSTHQTLPFLDLCLVQHHHAVCAVGRRSLGGAGAVHDPGRGEARGRPGHNRDGHRHGRANRQYDSALLGLARPGHRRARDQGHHGLLHDRARRGFRALWRVAACLCLGWRAMSCSPQIPRIYADFERTDSPAIICAHLRNLWISFPNENSY